MYCTQCGQPLAPHARFCMHCGAPVTHVPAAPAPAASAPHAPSASAPTPAAPAPGAPTPSDPSAPASWSATPAPGAPASSASSAAYQPGSLTPVRPAPSPRSQDRGKKPRSGKKTLLLSLLAVVLLIVVSTMLVVPLYLLMPKSNEVLLTALQSLLEVACAAGAIVLLGGKGMLRPRREGIACALRIGGIALAADVALALWDLWDFFASGEAVDPAWPLNLLVTLGLMLAIGMAEELIFRGLIFNGLLAPLGNTRRGMYAAVALSALVFGCAHVSPADFGSPLLAVQALLKILQTGLWSLIPVAVLMRTGDVLAAGLFHGLGNFVLSVDMIVSAPQISFEYTSADVGEAQGIIGVYLLVILMYLPSIYAALRSIRAQPAPCNGAFAQAAAPLAQVEPVVRCLPPAPEREGGDDRPSGA